MIEKLRKGELFDGFKVPSYIPLMVEKQNELIEAHNTLEKRVARLEGEKPISAAGASVILPPITAGTPGLPIFPVNELGEPAEY